MQWRGRIQRQAARMYLWIPAIVPVTRAMPRLPYWLAMLPPLPPVDVSLPTCPLPGAFLSFMPEKPELPKLPLGGGMLREKEREAEVRRAADADLTRILGEALHLQPQRPEMRDVDELPRWEEPKK